MKAVMEDYRALPFREFPRDALFTLSAALTPAEEGSPYAWYYRRGPVEGDPSVMAALAPDRPMDPTLAVRPEEIGQKLLAPEMDVHQSGYCVLDDGIGYAALWTDCGEISPAIETYWRENWRPEGDLFYKCWCPGAHIRHFADAAFEDLGRGPEMIELVFPPSLLVLGFPTDYQRRDPDFLGLTGGNGTIYALDDAHYERGLDVGIFRFLRRHKAGWLDCTRIWMGVHILGGPARPREGTRAWTIEDLRLLARHCAIEQATERRNKLDFYERTHG